MKIVELPLPRPVIFKKQRLPASYANFYIANNLVLVPTFNDPNDRVALNILASVFPNMKLWASIAAISSGAWAPSTARRNKNRYYFCRFAPNRCESFVFGHSIKAPVAAGSAR